MAATWIVGHPKTVAPILVVEVATMEVALPGIPMGQVVVARATLVVFAKALPFQATRLVMALRYSVGQWKRLSRPVLVKYCSVVMAFININVVS